MNVMQRETLVPKYMFMWNPGRLSCDPTKGDFVHIRAFYILTAMTLIASLVYSCTLYRFVACKPQAG